MTTQQQPHEEEQQETSFVGQMLNSLPRFMLMYFAITFVSQTFFKGPQQEHRNDAFPSSDQERAAKPVTTLYSSWKVGDKVELSVFTDQSPDWSPITSHLVWNEKDIKFADFSDERKAHLTVSCTEAMKNNGSLYAHIFLTKEGLRPQDWQKMNGMEQGDKISYRKKLLTRYQPKKRVIKKKKLVGDSPADLGKEETESDAIRENDGKQRPIVSYWWKNLTINHVGMDDQIPAAHPPQIAAAIELDHSKRGYKPIIYLNDFWMLQENLLAINSTVETLDLFVTFSPIAFWKFQMYSQFSESFRIQTEVMGADPAEQDQIKSMFLDTNPILLAVTIAVSLLHSLFDFLAFKNDINFWKNKKSMEGISFRSLLLGIIFQVIIFLYLMDNETSYMILVSQAIGLVIEVWKINKTVIVKRKPQFPYVEFIDRVKPSRLAAKTQKYDRMAFSYLSVALFPLLVCYTIYSVMYEQHKSWYSFIIGTLVGFVYTFGFIQQTPQLFINFKLKSVAHMPVKTFIYKALNTFIDDLFAFVIKMPWLHRLACLRDDVVFLVYLYQRWIYREDKRRRNEFGQVGEDVDEGNDDDDEFSSDDGEDGGKKKSGEEKEAKEVPPQAVAEDSHSTLLKRTAVKSENS